MINRREAAKAIASIAAAGILPETAQAEVLTVHPNEAVLLTIPERIKNETRAMIKSAWDEAWRARGMEPPLCIVLSDGVKATVVRKSEAGCQDSGWTE